MTRNQIIVPKMDTRLAEFVGIMLGDGSIFCNGSTFQVRVHGDLINEREFIESHVNRLVKDIFGVRTRVSYVPFYGGVNLCVDSKSLVEFLTSIGLKPGNKVKNDVGIPEWIKSDTTLLASCIRGLIDTDGSVFRMSRKDFDRPRIEFKNSSKKLLEDAREALISIGFNPSKVISGNHFFLSRSDEIERYSIEVKFHNKKHIERLKMIDPSSSGQEGG